MESRKSEQSTTIYHLPPDVLKLIFREIPEIAELYRSRRVASLFRNNIDQLISQNPKITAIILLSLHGEQFKIFLATYQKSEGAQKLIEKYANNPNVSLTAYEKICLQALLRSPHKVSSLFQDYDNVKSNQSVHARFKFNETDFFALMANLPYKCANKFFSVAERKADDFGFGFSQKDNISMDRLHQLKAIKEKEDATPEDDANYRNFLIRFIFLTMLLPGYPQLKDGFNEVYAELQANYRGKNPDLSACIPAIRAMISARLVPQERTELAWQQIREGTSRTYTNFFTVMLNQGNLMNMDFTNSRLDAASFRGSNLSGSNFSGITIYSCDFCDADLRNVNMTNVNFAGNNTAENARFEGAIFSGVYIPAITGEINLSGANLEGSKWFKTVLKKQATDDDVEKLLNEITGLSIDRIKPHDAVMTAIAKDLIRIINKIDDTRLKRYALSAARGECLRLVSNPTEQEGIQLLTRECDKLQNNVGPGKP